MLIGTAGHIDHGKTALVRALTGVDTDRLPEEKARGISIELGYAYVPIANGEVIGFVDVPGHERFVRTMIAGAWGIDFALLVVAADDGVMPQTLEHLEILDLLGIARGAVAVTKRDRVSATRLDEVRAEIAAELAPTVLPNAALFAVNSVGVPADPALDRLRSHLQDVALGEHAGLNAASIRRRNDGLFRLAVDRAFTLPGHGTVVTGTIAAGTVRVGDTLQVMPSGRTVRVRSLHAQARPAAMARAGQRCALNLAGIEVDALERGNWLADARAFAPTMRIDAHVRVLAGASGSLRAWSAVHLHAGSAHVMAHAVPLSADVIAPGESGRVQLVPERPLCVVAGERFILRDARAERTLGGGIVLDTEAPPRRRRSEERARYLDALEALTQGAGVGALLACAPGGIAQSQLARLTGMAPEQLELPPDTVLIQGGAEPIALHRAHWQALRERALIALRQFHDQFPDEAGADVGRLRRIAAPTIAPALWRQLIEELLAQGALLRRGAWLSLPGHEVALSAADQMLIGRLSPLLVAGRFDPPWVRALATALDEPEDRVRTVLRRQLRAGAVQQIVRDLFYDATCVEELAAVVRRLAREHGAVEAAAFRDALGIGRKRAIQLLEFFDRAGLTRRVRDRHLLREDSGWSTAAPTAALYRKVYVPGGATGLQTPEGASDASW